MTSSTSYHDRLVAAIDAAIASRNPRPKGAETFFTCPFPAKHEHGDAHPSARWNREKAVWTCDVCGGGGGARNLAEALGITTPEPSVIGETTYDYQDADGTVRFQVVRLDLDDGDKRIFQRKPDGAGGWTNNLKGVRRCLYGLPELATASPDRLVFVVEGEKCVLAARELGCIATTNPGGAGKWASYLSAPLKGRHVVLIGDNDGPGRHHVAHVAQALLGVAATIRIIEALPDVGEGGDLADWAPGHTQDDLGALVAATEPRTEAALATFAAAEGISVPGAPSTGTIGPELFLPVEPPSVAFDDAGRMSLAWPTLDVTIRSERMERTRSGLRSQLSIASNGKMAVAPFMFSTNRLSARREVAQLLRERRAGVAWADVVEQACAAIIENEGTPIPGILLSDVDLNQEALWDIEPLVPRKMPCVLFGDGGSAKTLIALALSVSFASAACVLPGLVPERSQPVIYLDYESTEQALALRYWAIARAAGVEHVTPPIVYLRGIRPLPLDLERVEHHIRLHDAGLLVTDSAGLASGGEAEESAAALQHFNALRYLNVSSITITHIPNDPEARERPFGSVYWRNSPRATWEARAASNEDIGETLVGLYHRKHNETRFYGALGFRAAFDGNPVQTISFDTADLSEDATLEAGLSLSKRVLALLRDGRMTAADILIQVGGKPSTLRTTLSRLRRDNALIRFGEGKTATWGVPDHHQEVLS